MSNFDETCYEESVKNRMTDSLNCFCQLANEPELKDKTFIIIFNQIDLFKKKIQLKPKYEAFLQIFPEYNEGHDEQKILDFITYQFLQVAPKYEEIAYYYSNAINNDSVKSVFDQIFCMQTPEVKRDIQPKERIMIHSKLISDLTTFESIKELFIKYDLDKSGYLEEDEVKKFFQDLQKDNTGYTDEILKNILSMMDIDKDAKISLEEFISFISKAKPPSFLFCGGKNSGKSSVLKHFKLYQCGFKDKTRVKDIMYQNLHTLMMNILLETKYVSMIKKRDQYMDKIRNCPYGGKQFQSYMINHGYFTVYEKVLSKKRIKQGLETYENQKVNVA